MSTLHSRLLGIAAFSSLFLFASAEVHAEETAASYFASGIGHYSKENYDQAAEDLKKSYELQADQRTLFAWAQAERFRGNCEKSQSLLEQYISNGANSKQTAAAFEVMKDCQPKDGPWNEEKPVSNPPVETTPVDNTLPPEKSEEPAPNSTTTVSLDTNSSKDEVNESPWYRDWVGASLLTSGAVGLVAGGTLYGMALNKESQAQEDGVTSGEYDDLKSQAESLRPAGVAVGVIGGVLVAAGVTYIFLPRDSKEENATVSMFVDENASGFLVSGRF